MNLFPMMGRVEFILTLLIYLTAQCWSACTIDSEKANTRGTQSEVLQIAIGKTLTTCKDICLLTDECVAADINPTSGLCTLYNAQTVEITDASKIFFNKSCTADPVVPCTMGRTASTRGGQTLIQLKLVSYDHCSSACLYLTDCTGVTYSGGSCHIYTRTLLNSNTGDVPQGIKQQCLGDLLGKQCCVEGNTNLKVNGTSTFSVTQSLESCESVCIRTSSCVSVGYKDGVCYLYTSSTSTTSDSLSTYSVKTCTGTVPPQGSITTECVGASSQGLKQTILSVAVLVLVAMVSP